MMRDRFVLPRLMLCLLALLVAAAPARAQSTATLQGTITDAKTGITVVYEAAIGVGFEPINISIIGLKTVRVPLIGDGETAPPRGPPVVAMRLTPLPQGECVIEHGA